MLAVSTAARLSAKGVRRAVIVSGRRQGAVHAVRTQVRGIQSVAQTDRVYAFRYNLCNGLLTGLLGHNHPFALFNWH